MTDINSILIQLEKDIHKTKDIPDLHSRLCSVLFEYKHAIDSKPILPIVVITKQPRKKDIATAWIIKNNPSKKQTLPQYYEKYLKSNSNEKTLSARDFSTHMRTMGYKAVSGGSHRYWKFVDIDSDDTSTSGSDTKITDHIDPLPHGDTRTWGIIYLLRNPSMPDGSLKLGMTKQKHSTRIKSYGPDVVIYSTHNVANPEICEQTLIQKFTQQFGNPIKGREIFHGDLSQMCTLFAEIVNAHIAIYGFWEDISD